MLSHFVVDRTPQDTTESTLVFTKGRDIHAVGIALVQMLMGRDVMDRFPDPQSALHTSKFRIYVRTDVYSPKCLQPPYLPSSSRRLRSCSLRRGRTVFLHRASLGTSCLRRLSPRVMSALRLFRFQVRRIVLHDVVPVLLTFLTGPKIPMVNGFFTGSPETDYFRMPPPKPKHASRWKEDWEELELLVCSQTMAIDPLIDSRSTGPRRLRRGREGAKQDR